jgi:phage recombination protein Bet
MSTQVSKIVDKYGWTDSQIQTIINTVAVGATEDELQMFLSIAKQYNLNPFVSEIYYAKLSGDTKKGTIILSVHGLRKIANSHPMTAIFKSQVVHENDTFECSIDGDSYTHKFSHKDRGAAVGAYCYIKRRDRDQGTFQYVNAADYANKNTNVWASHRTAMLLKCAENNAIKRTYEIENIMGEGEYESIQEKADELRENETTKAHEAATIAAKAAMQAAKTDADYTPLLASFEQLEQIRELLTNEHITDEVRKAAEAGLNDLSPENAVKYIAKLEKIIREGIISKEASNPMAQ